MAAALRAKRKEQKGSQQYHIAFPEPDEEAAQRCRPYAATYEAKRARHHALQEDDLRGLVVESLLELMWWQELTAEDLFLRIVRGKSWPAFPRAYFNAFVEQELAVFPEQTRARFFGAFASDPKATQMERKAFISNLELHYFVPKAVIVTTELKAASKAVRKTSALDGFLYLEGPRHDDTTGLARIRARGTDGEEGWLTLGTAFGFMKWNGSDTWAHLEVRTFRHNCTLSRQLRCRTAAI